MLGKILNSVWNFKKEELRGEGTNIFKKIIYVSSFRANMANYIYNDEFMWS